MDKNTDTKEQTGTPTMVLLPARNYKFKVVNEEYKIVIPRKGSYAEIDPEFFSEEDGEFHLMDGRTKALYLPSISKVLFATQQYPDLKSEELFAPVLIKFKKDEVEIIGQKLEMLLPE